MVSQEQAEAELKQYPTLRECVTYGWTSWEELKKIAPAKVALMKPRSRASIISDFINAKVTQEFASSRQRGVRLVEKHGFPELMVRGKYVIRFKKLDQKGRSRNFPTKQQRLWMNGQLPFEGMSPMQTERLIAGYVLNLLGTDLDRVLVTSPINTTAIKWAINLESETTNVIEFAKATQAPPAPTVRSRQKKTDESDRE